MGAAQWLGLAGVIFSLLVILTLLLRRYFRNRNRRLQRLYDDRRERNECWFCGYGLRLGDDIYDKCPNCGVPNISEEILRDSEFDLEKLQGGYPEKWITARAPEVHEPRLVIHATRDHMCAFWLRQQLEAHGVWSCEDVIEKREPPNRIAEYYVVFVLVEEEAAARAIIDQFRLVPVEKSEGLPSQ